MAYTHHELKHKTLAELRDIAKDIEHDAVKGYTQLNKEHLVVAICNALNIDIHEHHALGSPIAEIGVHWEHQEGSKVKWKDYVDVFMKVPRIVWSVYRRAPR